MAESIPFAEGSYVIEESLLYGPSGKALSLSEAFIEVYRDSRGRRHLRGQGLVQNLLLVDLLEDDDRLDLLMDLGEGFRFRLKAPKLHAGKVFSPTTRSIVHFAPSGNIETLSDETFARERAALTLSEGSDPLRR